MREERGFIYVIEDEPGICKIGKSQRFPSKRALELSTKHHKPYKLRSYFYSYNLARDEQIIHNALMYDHIRGEWFRFTYEEIKDQLNKNYKFEDFLLEEEDFMVTYPIQMPPAFFTNLECLLDSTADEEKQIWIREKLIKYLNQMIKKNNQSDVDEMIGEAATFCSNDVDEDWR